MLYPRHTEDNWHMNHEEKVEGRKYMVALLAQIIKTKVND